MYSCVCSLFALVSVCFHICVYKRMFIEKYSIRIDIRSVCVCVNIYIRRRLCVTVSMYMRSYACACVFLSSCVRGYLRACLYWKIFDEESY